MDPTKMETDEDIVKFNRQAWNRSVADANRWTVPVDAAAIEKAKSGNVAVYLTPKTVVPPEWLTGMRGRKVLGLAAGGGQQGPLLAAFGAEVTVFDLAEEQLAQDQRMAEEAGLEVLTVQGRADDLSAFHDSAFDYILNPCSNCFFPGLPAVWRECARVLKPGGEVQFGFIKPESFLFDFEQANKGHFVLKYKTPFSDVHSFNPEEKKRYMREGSPVEFGHSWSDQLRSLMAQGFAVIDLFEDEWDTNEPINRFFPQFVAVRARKL